MRKMRGIQIWHPYHFLHHLWCHIYMCTKWDVIFLICEITFLFACWKFLICEITFYSFRFWGLCKNQIGQRPLKSSRIFPNDQFDRLKIFYRGHMQNLETFYHDIFLQNTSKFMFSNFPYRYTPKHNYISKDFNIWSFYDFSFIFPKAEKAIHGGRGVVCAQGQKKRYRQRLGYRRQG